MRNLMILTMTVVTGSLLFACEVDQTQEGRLPELEYRDGELPEYEVRKTEDGRMPDVDVAQPGQLPRYDIDAPDVDVNTGTRQVEIPTLDVDVTPANEDND